MEGEAATSASCDDNVITTGTSAQHASEHLHGYDIYGFKPDATLDDDDNYMELCMLVTRNSICNQGHMGCVLVGSDTARKSAEDSSGNHRERIYGSIIGVSTNKPLYTTLDSDVHAEIGALGEAARRGIQTEGCTAYITMPPCKNCFGALLAAGCTRVVTPRAKPAKTVERVAGLKGVEMVVMDEDRASALQVRIDTLINASRSSVDPEEQKAAIMAKRKQRKEAQRQKKEKKRRTQEENRKIHEETNKCKSSLAS